MRRAFIELLMIQQSKDYCKGELVMKKEYDLSKLEWTLTGYIPNIWRFEKMRMMGSIKTVDTEPVKARVPGSVQASLLDAGIIEDWNIGDNSKKCEWVENRHWVYRTGIPDEWLAGNNNIKLNCMGLDYSGWIYLNDHEIASFEGTHVPHTFNLAGNLKQNGNVLEIIFDVPPRWLGQFGHTSKMNKWKTRFNYGWDFIPRMVQTGIWDEITLVASDREEFDQFKCTTDADIKTQTGILWISGEIAGYRAKRIRCLLMKENTIIADKEFEAAQFKKGIVIKKIHVELWWPNLEGKQPIYELKCSLLDNDGSILDEAFRRVGFRHIEWIACKGAHEEADPWVCVVNGKPLFLQGFNFQPIRPNYADLKWEDYEKRLKICKEIGTNFLRINACGFLEFEWFYDLCDEMGIMVWQEFPLTASGIENWPPEEEKYIEEMVEIARSFITRRQHHVSLIAWGGGNELQGDLSGHKIGIGKPCGLDHPMLGRLKEVVRKEDPTRRYIPVSPSGPRDCADEKDYGKGLHWDVHGPNANFESKEKQEYYLKHDDALFRSEIYVTGANPVEMIRKYKGAFAEMPASLGNPYWCRPTPWWNDWDILINNHGHEPENLGEYVKWSQENQTEKLFYVMKKCKERFPYIGGVLMWGSHETFPLPANTTIMDFEGNPKPAAFALAKVWRSKQK